MTENFDPVNLAEMYEEAERFDDQADNSNKDFLANFVQMPEKEGFVVVRLLPPMKGKKFYCATRTHKLLKDPNDRRSGKNLHCPRELITAKNGKKMWVDMDKKCPCPVCMWTRSIWAKVEAAGGKETPQGRVFHAEYSRIKAIERYYYNCIVRIYNKKFEFEKNEGPKILSVGKTVHEKIVRKITGDPKAGEKGYGDITDFKNGLDFKIIKRFKSGNTYAGFEDSKFDDRPSLLGTPEEIQEWLANMHDLAALRVLKPVSELSIELKKYTGVLPSNDETSFDVSEYLPKEAMEDKVAEVVREPKPTGVTSSPVTEGMDEEEFFRDIENVPNTPEVSN